jgi:hypothetical protein
MHPEVKGGIDLASLRKEIQEIPLGHEGDEAAPSREVGKVSDDNLGIADIPGKSLCLLMWPLQEIVEEAKLVHDLQRRRVDGVTPKIAKKIAVLFQNEDFHTRPGEQEAEHYSGWATAGDAAGDVGHIMMQSLSLTAAPYHW